ncbi:MAG: hypothetical protein ACEQR8_09475, partial [Cypionkella sp.]
MALAVLDRLLTIAVTATLTSAVWIVGGETLLSGASSRLGGIATQGGMGGRPAGEPPRPAEPAPSESAARAARPGKLVIPVAGIDADEQV